jgi:hypothetical protein
VALHVLGGLCTLCAIKSPVCIKTIVLVHGTVDFCAQYHGLMYTGDFSFSGECLILCVAVCVSRWSAGAVDSHYISCWPAAGCTHASTTGSCPIGTLQELGEALHFKLPFLTIAG